MKRAVLRFVFVLLLSLAPISTVSATSDLNIEFEVPAYTIDGIGNYDYVEIPGGSILLEEEGRPRVPYYSYSFDLEKGCIVQEVTMVERSVPENQQGLNLPLVVLQWTIAQPVIPLPGWYPEIEFEWNLVKKPDGGNILEIIVYPIRYNPETDELLFYRNYSFLASYVNSPAELVQLNLDKSVYIPGETVNIEAIITSAGFQQDLYLDLTIRHYGSDEIAAGLPVRLLKELSGIASVSAEWNSTSATEGDYYIEAILSDASGNFLDIMRTGFGLNTTGDVQPTTPAVTTTIPATTTLAPGPITTSASYGLLKRIKDYLPYIGIGAGILVLLIILYALRHKAI